jgi:hypothetical protein
MDGRAKREVGFVGREDDRLRIVDVLCHLSVLVRVLDAEAGKVQPFLQ